MRINFKLFSKIEFWLIFFFVIRLYGITNPPLETGHNWRQSDVLMAARNFYETDSNIFYPRNDLTDGKSGITGMEFPLLNYLIYLVSLLFGYNHWYGRLINLIFSFFGTYYFFLIIRDFINKKTAFYSAILLCCSLWFAHSRKAIPDIFAVSMVMAGLYYGLCYIIKNKSYHHLLAYTILILFGILSKISAGYLLVIPLILLFNKNYPANRKVYMSLLTSAVLFCVWAWYFYWVPHLNNTFGIQRFFMGVSCITGLKGLIQNMGETLKKFYETALMYSGFAVFLTGIYYMIKRKNSLLGMICVACFLSFSIFILKSGQNFSIHSYYILVFIPVMALIAGYGIAEINKNNLGTVLVVIVCLENIINQQHDFYIRKDKLEVLQLESDLDKSCSRAELIAINSDGNPTPMYLAHRKGWAPSNSYLVNKDYISEIRQKGCRYVVVFKKNFGCNNDLDFPKIFENDTYKIYKL